MPLLQEVLGIIKGMAADWAEIPMLAKTHGQPASPTRVGKEFNVFAVRLEEQIRQFSQLTYPAKFGGATGNMNAHKVAYPAIDWIAFGNDFVASLGLKKSGDVLVAPSGINHRDHLESLLIGHPSTLDHLRHHTHALLHLARHDSAPMHEYLHPRHGGKIPDKLPQKHRIVNYISTYLYNFYHILTLDSLISNALCELCAPFLRHVFL